MIGLSMFLRHRMCNILKQYYIEIQLLKELFQIEKVVKDILTT